MNICDIGWAWCALYTLGCMLVGGVFGVCALALAIMAKDPKEPRQ